MLHSCGKLLHSSGQGCDLIGVWKFLSAGYSPLPVYRAFQVGCPFPAIPCGAAPWARPSGARDLQGARVVQVIGRSSLEDRVVVSL